MAETFGLVIDGLNHLRDLESLPQDIIRSARIAVNEAATRGRTKMGDEVRSQINFPHDYVAPRNKRLYVSEKATNKTLEAIITARSRATSLARFAEGGVTKGQSNVRVELKRGVVRQIPGKNGIEKGYRAFLIRLKSAGPDTDTKNNLGLALRVPAGKKPNAAFKPKRLGSNLYLLYGPSVSQLILPATNPNRGVASKLTPEIQDMLSDEFWRQMEL